MKKLLMFVLIAALLAGATFGQNWMAVPNKDLMTGVTSYNIFSTAETSQGTIRDAALGFRVKGQSVEIMVLWGGYSMDLKKGSVVRFGEAVAVPWPVDGISHDDEVLFLGDVSGFLAKIKSMSPTDAIVIQSTRATGSNSIARWYVGNIHEVAKGVIAGW